MVISVVYIIVPTSFLNLALSGRVKRNNQIATIATWGPQYRVAVDIKVYSAGTEKEWYNILRFTSTESDCCNIGDRIPAIFYNTEGFLRITSSVNGNGDDYIDYDIESDKWYQIRILQTQVTEKDNANSYYN